MWDVKREFQFQGGMSKGNFNVSVPTTPTNHYKYHINFSGHVPDLAWFC